MLNEVQCLLLELNLHFLVLSKGLFARILLDYCFADLLGS